MHLKTFKYGAHYEAPHDSAVRDLHRLVVEVFQSPAYAIFYVLAMIVLGVHLRHGISSALQSLGGDHPGLTPTLLKAGVVVAALIALGFASIPLYLFLKGGAP